MIFVTLHYCNFNFKVCKLELMVLSVWCLNPDDFQIGCYSSFIAYFAELCGRVGAMSMTRTKFEGIKILETLLGLQSWTIPAWSSETRLAHLCLRTDEHFLVGQRGDQAEAVTLGGLDVHDGRFEEPEPSPPDAWGLGATGCRRRCRGV